MGIYFGSESTDSLGVYEEGTWTPTFSGGSNFNYDGNHSSGNYIRVGDIVHIRCYLGFGNPAFTAGGQSWNIICGGLPFAPSISGYSQGVISVRCNSIGTYSLGNYIFGIVSNSAATVQFKVTKASSIEDDALTAAMCNNYTSFAMQGTYHL